MIREFERLDMGEGESVLLWASGALMQRHFCSTRVFDRHKMANARVLELGSGSGLLAMQLRSMGEWKRDSKRRQLFFSLRS
jgi:hypothetical protein